ncbi:MAG: DUF3068 domain-containing protein [Acidimicrobiia bacterium]|nr:DUF3068 domain-containing protein [Acidimicrobiia bacterium]
MRFDRRASRSARVVAGIAVVVGAVAWHAVEVPRRQDVPPGHRQEVNLEGDLDLHFDPWTLNPVVPPRSLRFEMDQVASTEPGPDHSIAVDVRQTSQASAAVNTESVNRYIIDPRTRQNLDSDEAWAYDPAIVVDRAPAYSLSLPAGFDPDRTYPWFESTTDGIYDLEPTGRRSEIGGLELVTFGAEFEGAASRAYLMNLATFGLPEDLTPDEVYRMSPQPVDRVAVSSLRAALPDLPADLRSAIEPTLDVPIPVSYRVSGDLVFDFEPRSGALVNVRSVTHLLVARVDLSGLEAVAAALRSWGDPAGSRLAAQLGPLDEMTELPVFTYHLTQTEASAASVARQVQGDLRTLGLVGTWLPLAVGLAGIALVATAAIRRRGPGPDDARSEDGGVLGGEEGSGFAHEEAAASRADDSQPVAAASRQSSRGESDQSFSSL